MCIVVPVVPPFFHPSILWCSSSPPSLALFFSVQHSNPGHAGPFPVASLHNANPTSPTSASMAGAHAHRGPASPIIGPIELIPSVTNPENLPCLPEIPPIQVRTFYVFVVCEGFMTFSLYSPALFRFFRVSAGS